MILKYFIPLFALAMLGFGIIHMVKDREVWAQDQAPLQPASSPFNEAVAAAGVVEAQTQNIAIGSPEPGVVVEIFVQVGERVHAGDPLFRLDDRYLAAELKVRQSALASAQAEQKRLLDQPRKEQLPVHEALVREAQAKFANEEYQVKRVREIFRKDAAAEDELRRQEQAFSVAEAQLARARAELDLLKAGSWEADRLVAGAAVAQAEARVEQVRTELDRLVVRALVDGEVLQINVRAGEFVGAPAGQPLIILGDIQQLHVRVDIDEYDIHRFRPESRAMAALKGAHRDQFPLTLVRVEPLVIPKKSLTGVITERVDTRVLQVLYSIGTGGRQLYVGQQLDVFVEAAGDAP
jgi:HlyD family secretion protein